MDHDSHNPPSPSEEPFDPRKQGGQFDKVVKENIDASLPFLLEQLLGLPYHSFVMQAPDVQVTLERKADVVLLLKETPRAVPYIMHLEFQSGNTLSMPGRMLTYNGVLRSRHVGMSIRQRVIYLGNDPVTMPNTIKDEGLEFSFQILDLRELPAKPFLAAEVPEAVVFAILANYGDLSPEDMIQAIIHRLKELVSEPVRLQTYIIQVGVLTQLRSLETVFTETIEHMSIEIDEYRIPFVGEALLKAEKKGTTLGITKAFEIQKRLKEGETDLEALAQEFEVTVEQVRYIQQQS